MYTSISMTLRLAAFSIGSASNGLDGGDIVTVEVSPDGGVNWYNTVEVTGTSNARWAYTASGIASASYDGDNTPDSFSPSSGGIRTTDGYSTITISGLPAIPNLRFRITLLNDTNSERWVVDDFKVQGVVACVPPTIANVYPNSGPVGTNVTVNASSGNLSGATAKFNGVTATVVSTTATQIIVVVPSGATSGNLTITNTSNCPVSTPFTIIKEEKTSCDGSSFGSDLIIYEVHDEKTGNGGVISIYNGTGVSKDLSNYTIYRTSNANDGNEIDYAVLTGILAPGALAVIKVNAGDCGPAGLYGIINGGFNDGDGLQLRTKDGATIIDDVDVDSTTPGYYKTRISNPLTPRSVYVASEWIEISLAAGQCVPTLGIPPVVAPGSGNPPVITTQPIFSPSCTNISFTVVATEGFIGGNPLAYQWYALAPNTATWFALTNVGVYSGTTTSTLNISATTGLDGYQYYSQVRENTATCYSASNAVMIKVGASGGPVITNKTPTPICSGTAFTVTPTNTLPDVVPTGTTYTWAAPVIAPVAAISGGSERTTPISSISQILTNTTTAVATATYTVKADSGGCSSTFTITVTVNPLPTITTTPGSRCGTGVVTIEATANPGTINWYSAATAGTLLASGTFKYTTPSISSTTSYWVEATTGTCTSNSRVEVIATITSNGSIPKPTVKTPVEYCLSTTTPASPLTATTTVFGATLNWYATLTSTPALASAPIPNITTVSSITYYVSQSLAGCEGPREAIVVNVIADTGAIATGFVCDPSQITTSPVSSVYFDWANVVGRTGYYRYSYSIDGGPLVFGFTENGRSSQEVFGVIPGQKVEFTIVEVQGVPCFKPQTISCSLACTTNTVPDFTSIPATQSICTGSTAPVLPPNSNNGISGTWLPATVSNTTTGTYEFTPDPILFPCASTVKKDVVVTPKVTPTFAPTTTSYCQNAIITLPILPTTSSNSITGTWNPASISTSALGTIVHDFTPSTGSCAISTSISITVNANVAPTFNPVGPICSGATLSALPTTSLNGITGTWSPALNNTATTIYTFTPTAGLCATTTTLTIVVNPNVTPTFDAIPATCSGATIPGLPTTSLNGVTGTWSPVINNTSTTIYTFTPTTGLCATTTPLTITIDSKVTPTFLPVAPICSGGILLPLPLTSTNGITGTWSPALNNLATTTYTFIPNAGFCAISTTLVITVNQKVTPTFNAIPPVCLGDTILALPTTSLNGIVGTWSPSLNNTVTTIYTFTPTSSLCASSTQITITVNLIKTTPTFNSIGSLCFGTNITLPPTSINNITGVWSPPFNPLLTTSYTFTPDSGQCATTTNQTVTIIPLPVATNTTGPLSICSGDKTFISLFSDIPGTTFTWNVVQTNASGATAGTGTRIEPNLETVSNKSGEAVYSITPNNNGCKGASIEVAITVNPIPDVKYNTEKSTICSGTSTNISLTSGVVGTTYTWTVNATPNVFGALSGNGNLIQQELSTNDLTQGSVIYTITPDSNGCLGTAIDVTITVDPLPDSTAVVAKNPICSGETTKIDLSSTIGASFNWTVIQTGVTGATKGTGASIEQTLQAGTVAGIAGYIITPILNGCEGTPNPVIINVNPLPVAVIQEDGLLCIRKDGTVKSSFILNTNLSDSEYDFVWYKDNAVIPPPFPPLLPPTSNYEVTEIGDYYVAVTNKLTTCYAESNSALITSISPADYIDPPIVTDAFTDNATVIINVFPPADYYLYQMDFGPLQDFNEFTQVKGGSHIIRVTDAIGCTDLSSPARVISYPKFFTPNGDGYNDTWNIIDLGDQPNAKLYIFDRHGKLLKQVSTFGNGWDGTYNGKQLPASDYWFSLNYFENDVLKLFKAHFSLKR
ncbi:PKD-like domain-containing protein [Flavobacterium myungsuense]|uniref:PKD-like domain-containing protein n=1 Tax=Flavobacterium myungsuense TaxID=651823 RepID=UPI00363827C8